MSAYRSLRGEESPTVDKLAELSHGAKVVLGSAIAFLIVSFFNWFKYGGVGIWNMWHGVGVIAGLLAIALIAWQAVRLANINVEIGVTPSMITAVLAILLLIFTFIRFISTPYATDRTIWAWIGLVLAIVIVVGAWANMKAAGEGFAEVKAKAASMTSSGKDAAPAQDAAPPQEAAPAQDAAPDAAPAQDAAPDATGGDTPST